VTGLCRIGTVINFRPCIVVGMTGKGEIENGTLISSLVTRMTLL
jgi:hypothetical protein